jgi:hypothetical protein
VGGITSSSVSSSDLSLGGGVNGVYLSSNATPPAGYSSGGSLYRGSGFWVRTLSTARAGGPNPSPNSTKEAMMHC